MATRSGLPQSRISEFESGTKPSKVEHLEALSDVLDCTVGFLLGREYKHVTTDQAVSRMAFNVFADREETTELQRQRCRRVLGRHQSAPITADSWTDLAQQMDLAVPPTGVPRKFRVVNENND